MCAILGVANLDLPAEQGVKAVHARLPAAMIWSATSALIAITMSPESLVSREARTIRVNDRIWDAAVRKADREGRFISEVIRQLLAQWVGTIPEDDKASGEE